MTTMGLDYLKYQESQRSNLANEAETNRSNLARETETNRSNLAREAETHRANVAGEQETHRSNMAKEAETNRANTMQDTREWAKINESKRATDLKHEEAKMKNQTEQDKLSETRRANEAKEELSTIKEMPASQAKRVAYLNWANKYDKDRNKTDVMSTLYRDYNRYLAEIESKLGLASNLIQLGG